MSDDERVGEDCPVCKGTRQVPAKPDPNVRSVVRRMRPCPHCTVKRWQMPRLRKSVPEEGVTMETLWQHEKRRAERAEAAMEANIATLELCQEAVVELERKLYLAGTDLIEVRDQRDAARTERNALRAENKRLRDGLDLRQGDA